MTGNAEHADRATQEIPPPDTAMDTLDHGQDESVTANTGKKSNFVEASTSFSQDTQLVDELPQNLHDAETPVKLPTSSVLEEFSERLAYCGADYRTAFNWCSKSLSAALFMFFATLFSTVALGAHLQQATDNRIGLSEYLLMNSAAGMLHALLGVQPLLIIRPTGPITSILMKLCALADSLSVDIYTLLAATSVFVSLLMFAIAFSGLARHIQRLTPFTYEIFACFVCSIYLHNGISDVVHRFTMDNLTNFGVSLFDLNLTLLVFGLSVKLQAARQWRCLPLAVRAVLADYAVTLSIGLATLCSFAVDVVSAQVLRIHLPASFAPSLEVTGGSVPFADVSEGTQRARPWYAADLIHASSRTWLAAAVASVPISFFFFMDQGISSLLCQLPELHLLRGHYYHASFACLGVFNFFGPMLGCPFVTASLPHSPQFVRALSTSSELGGPSHVAESRVAPFLVYLLIGLPLFVPKLIKAVPEAAIDGVLIFVGYDGIVCTGLWERLLLCLTPKYDVFFPAPMRAVRATRTRQYTLLQLSLLGLCWIVHLSPFGLAVSFVVVALVPLREVLLPRFFNERELSVLDSPRKCADPQLVA
mmetsp:Transcript_63917/g.106280  ORF Transcript_63917/g.106280 Transcript_63917/m.106280 type:complete len:591 (+) Transcript_63917:47-1819(+)